MPLLTAKNPQRVLKHPQTTAVLRVPLSSHSQEPAEGTETPAIARGYVAHFLLTAKNPQRVLKPKSVRIEFEDGATSHSQEPAEGTETVTLPDATLATVPFSQPRTRRGY